MKRSKSRSDLRRQTAVRVPGSYPWKVLDALVQDLRCSLLPEDAVKLRTVVRNRDYDAYLALSEAWGPQCIDSYGTSTDLFYARYQASHLLKKYQFPGDASQRRAAALLKFKEAEDVCREFNIVGSRNLAFLTDATDLSAFTYAKQFLSRVLGELLPEHEQLTFWSRHGPGANLDSRAGRTSLYDKYKSWPYSCTQQAVRYARLAIESDERWLDALRTDYSKTMHIDAWDPRNQARFWADVITVVPGNRITFVPKNSRIDRSIAIEPSLNLYLQLGVDGYIRRRLNRWGVHLDDQTKNQELARRGSREWTDPDCFVTLDLASASDSVTTELCRLLLPPQWYSYLMELRSPQGVLGNEVISYEKISSMGNGYTFALESALFTAIVYGVTKALKGRFDRDEFAVYGDDIIVRRSISDRVVHMLNLCGFSINPDKSFISGPFRESCGADWFRGAPVRPVFLKSNPTTVMELWGDLNRLRRILSLRIWGFEFEVTKLIARWVPQQFSNHWGPLSDEDFNSYMHTPAPTVRNRRGMWMFRRVVVTYKRRAGDELDFRKLMHPLRPTGERGHHAQYTWGGAPIHGVGSRFAITNVRSVIVSEVSSPAWNWQDEYNDLHTAGTGWSPH